MRKADRITRAEHHRREAKAARRRTRIANGTRRRPKAIERGLRASIANERLSLLSRRRKPKPEPHETRQVERKRPRLRDRLRFGRRGA